MARSYALPRGPRVCLRLIRLRDLRGLERLFERQGLVPDQLELARLVRADPRKQVVICATALIDSGEAIVGVGAIGADRAADREPSLLLADEQVTEGLAPLLAEALVGRAQALARPRAA